MRRAWCADQVFRESKIHDAVLFFDECESIFMDRTKGNMQAIRRRSTSHSAILNISAIIHQVNTVLTELERHEGLCILATNRPMDLDEVTPPEHSLIAIRWQPDCDLVASTLLVARPAGDAPSDYRGGRVHQTRPPAPRANLARGANLEGIQTRLWRW